MTNRSSRSKVCFCLLVVALALLGRPASSEPPGPIDADIVLVGGTILDGSGGPGTPGDVAIRGDRIAAIGRFEMGRVGRKISCDGLIVAPGFIDLHNHSDMSVTVEDPQTGESRPSRSILADRTRSAACYLTQGCTTIVTGNCGGGAVDVYKYYAEVGANKPGVNVAHLLPHGALRGTVIGQTRRGPSDEELDRMRDLARRAMEAGAWGMSTGLQYVPGAFADVAELGAIARVVGERGGFYASHIRDEGDQLIEAVEEAIEVGRRGRLPVHVSHFKASKRPNWGKVRAAAALIEQARADGHRVTADQYPYDASSTSITAMLLPDKEREGGTSGVIERLNDPDQLPRLRAIVQKSLEARDRIMIASIPKHPTWVGRLIREVAEDEKRAPVDVALDILRSGREQGVSFSMNQQDVRYVMTLPWAATASDGSTKIDDGTRPHPRSYGTFSRRIGRFAIEEGVVPVEMAVRSASGLPADILGLSDRGYLRSGYFADIAVFDPQTFRDHATFQSPFEVSTGMRWLFVNGQPAIDDGKLAVTDAGRPLRKSHKIVGVGAGPIDGAEVIFDGSRKMLDAKWTYWQGPRFSSSLPIKWKIVDDPVDEGTVVMTDDPAAAGGKYGTADVVTKKKYRDFRLHVEFLVVKEGGNSGVYLQNRYEIQVLDGDKSKHGMGAVINETPAPYHAYHGIGKWNAYDIRFRAARFKDGKRSEKAIVSMFFNGLKVHTNQKINQVWGGENSGIDGGNDGGKGITDTPGGLKLQCEGHEVLYRNIWIKELELTEPETDFKE